MPLEFFFGILLLKHSMFPRGVWQPPFSLPLKFSALNSKSLQTAPELFQWSVVDLLRWFSNIFLKHLCRFEPLTDAQEFWNGKNTKHLISPNSIILVGRFEHFKRFCEGFSSKNQNFTAVRCSWESAMAKRWSHKTIVTKIFAQLTICLLIVMAAPSGTTRYYKSSVLHNTSSVCLGTPT